MSYEYVFLNPEGTAVLHEETRRCIYLDRSSTVHSERYSAWVAEGGITGPYVPSAPLPIEQVQAAKWEAIKAERDRRWVGGVKVGGNWIHSDTVSRTQHLGLMLMGAGMPATLQWKTMDGAFVAMTPDLASQIFAAVAASDSTLAAVAETKHAEMMALADPAGYDVLAGWPPTHS